ncbi:MAG TPA: hypothetical protein VFS26_01580, partial [Solirubrobacterales bacterium]|nr:hypothetical protein [Solirubrobacterales bacterium]
MGAKRAVSFEGQAFRVPSGWPVYRLAQHPKMCVRLDRRVVYLGDPSSQQRCPADVIGRRRAILIESRSPAASASALGR